VNYKTKEVVTCEEDTPPLHIERRIKTIVSQVLPPIENSNTNDNMCNAYLRNQLSISNSRNPKVSIDPSFDISLSFVS